MENNRVLYCLIIAVLFLTMTGCDRPASPDSTNIWLDVPVNGKNVPEGTAVEINGHAASPAGITRVEIWINGSLEYELTGLAAVEELARFSQTWTPPGPGEYTIQVLGVDNDGKISAPDSSRITVGSEAVQEPAEEEIPATPTFTPTATYTPTPTTAPEVVIDFWVDPSNVQAGLPFTLYWHVENVDKVIFGGQEQPFDGSYSDTLCKDGRYTLIVEHTDGSREERVLDIDVQGSCATPTFTPTPYQDTTPPPSPTPLKPLDGTNLGCVSSAMLRWQAVSDESGIAQYQVELMRHPGDNDWEHVPGSRFTGISGTNLEVSLGCGYYYRWRVRAVDGSGNRGSWSAWFTFTVPLG